MCELTELEAKDSSFQALLPSINCLKIIRCTTPPKCFSSTIPHISLIHEVLSEQFWLQYYHITHAAARRLWQCFYVGLPHIPEQRAIRWTFPIPLRTALVRSEGITDTYPQLCSLLQSNKNLTPPEVLPSSLKWGKDLKLLNSSNNNPEKWGMIMGKEEEAYFELAILHVHFEPTKLT